MNDGKELDNQRVAATGKQSDDREVSVDTEAGGKPAFGARLREAFGKDGPYVWGKKLNMSPTTLQNWLSGRSEPSLQNLVFLSSELGVRIEWLAAGAGPKWVDDRADDDEAGSSHADPKLVRRLTREFSKVYKALGIAVDQLDVVELATEEHNRIRRHAAAGQALDAVVGYAVDQLRQRLLQANDEAASRKRPA